MVSALSGLILEKIYMTFSVGTKKTAAYMRKEGVRPGAGGGGGGLLPYMGYEGGIGYGF